MEMVDKFLTRMYRTNPDFVFTVTRDFVRIARRRAGPAGRYPAHPYAVAMEAAISPKAEVSIFPWKEPKERIPWRYARYVPSFGRIGRRPFRRRRRYHRADLVVAEP
jgi:hypothetical protein